MSDFLQFIDRIPTYPNRKKITHQDSSVEYATVEYADEPIEIGTLLNKNNLSEVNSIMGYNKCSSIIQQEITPKDYVLIKSESITPTWSNGGLNHNKISLEFESVVDEILGTYKPTLDIKNHAGVNFTDSSISGRVHVTSTINGYMRYTSAYFLSNMNRLLESNYNNIFSYDVSDKLIYFDFDFKHDEVNKIIKYSVGHNSRNAKVNSKIYYSDDGLNFILQKENIFNCSSNNFEKTAYTEQVGSHRYYRLEFSTTSDYFYFGDFSVNIQTYGTALINNILTNGDFNLVDNKILKISTPNFDLTDVTANTIDNIKCDVILQPNSRYTLIYNEDTNSYKIKNLLFDITLTEEVNQIDLTGITDMLEEGKVYTLIAYLNNATSSISNSLVYLGTVPVIRVSSSGGWFYCSPFIFIKFKYNNEINICGMVGSESSNYSIVRISKLTGAENINTGGSSTFPIGTRFIIKEVA